jgi:hypothetical protein
VWTCATGTLQVNCGQITNKSLYMQEVFSSSQCAKNGRTTTAFAKCACTAATPLQFVSIPAEESIFGQNIAGVGCPTHSTERTTSDITSVIRRRRFVVHIRILPNRNITSESHTQQKFLYKWGCYKAEPKRSTCFSCAAFVSASRVGSPTETSRGST